MSQAAFPASSPARPHLHSSPPKASPQRGNANESPVGKRNEAVPQSSKMANLVNSQQQQILPSGPTIPSPARPPQVPVTSNTQSPLQQASAPSVTATSSASDSPSKSPQLRSLEPPDNITQFVTMITRGDYGLGLDLEKISASGGASVKRIKEMPPGVINPAQACIPPIKEGDVIVGVNGKRCVIFAEVVKEIRASGSSIELRIDRKQ